MNYYRRFPGDYARDTQHLTTFQHGCYALLLDHLYSTEKPIASIEDCYRIARTANGTQRCQLRSILEQYFVVRSDGYWNNRVEEEINNAESRRNASIENGKLGGRPKPNRLFVGTLQESSPDSRLHTPLKNNFKTFSPTKPVLGSAEFLVFWEMYPNKVDRLESLKIWVRGMLDGFSREILAGLEQWKGSEQWSDGERIPYPSTWLNKRRWKETPKQKQTNGSKTDEAIKRYKNRSDSGVAGEIEPALQHGTLRRPN